MQMSNLLNTPMYPEEGSYLSVGPKGGRLTAFVHNPTPRELRTFRSGGVTAGLLEYKGVLFFLSKIKGFNKDWSDAPFCAAIEPPENQGLPVRGSHDGRMLKLSLTDPLRGWVHEERSVVLPSRFCDVFDELYARQLDATPRHDLVTYNAVVDEAYKKWPTGKAMMRDAQIRNIAI